MDANRYRDILFRSNINLNFQINPLEYGRELPLTDRSEIDISSYYNVSEIYREPMSSTSISVGTVPNTHEKVAIKKIYKEDLKSAFQKSQAVQEFPLHCSLNHTNIVKGIEWSENENEYLLTMEYMNNPGYFHEKIDVNLTPVKSEAKMQSYLLDILDGLSYLHSKGIVHGDIKLENMLVNTGEEGSIPIVKLCDLGLARLLEKDTGKFYMEIPVGSMSYMAPEIKARSQVNEKVDMWALGVVLYKMSVAYKPTQIAGYKYGTGPVPFRKFDWKKRSHELQDLIEKLLETDPEKRLSTEEALQHPWFQI